MRNRWKALLVGAMATGAVALPTAAQAAEIGQVCNVSVGASYWVSSQPSYEARYALYILGEGAGFRVEGFYGDFYIGHGNGRATGYFPRNNINQGSCHWE